MPTPLRACVFDPNSATAGALRAALEPIRNLQIIAECVSWQELQEVLCARRVDVVIVNLDGTDQSTNLISHVAETAPDCAILAVSQDAHPDTIISAMRAGCHQFVRWPIDPDDVQAALERVRQTHGPAATSSCRVCVIPASGGAGATTVACNLAIELAQVTKDRCGLVDLDTQYGDVACSFDCSPRYSLADVCRPGTQVDRAMVEDAVDNLPCNVSLLAAPPRIDVGLELSTDNLEETLRLLGQMFPFVVVDVPRHFCPLSMAALAGTDEVLVVLQPSVPHVRNASRVHEGLIQLGVDPERISIVLNRYNANFVNIRPEEIEKHFGRPVFATIPNDYKRIGTSRDLGHPIMSDAPDSPARRAIHQMARRLAELYGQQAAEERAGNGLLGLLRRRKRAETAV